MTRRAAAAPGRGPQGRAPRLGGPRARRAPAGAAAAGRGHLGRRGNDYGHPRPETLAALGAAPGCDLSDGRGRPGRRRDGRARHHGARIVSGRRGSRCRRGRAEARVPDHRAATARRSRPRRRGCGALRAGAIERLVGAVETARPAPTCRRCATPGASSATPLVVVDDVDGARRRGPPARRLEGGRRRGGRRRTSRLRRPDGARARRREVKKDSALGKAWRGRRRPLYASRSGSSRLGRRAVPAAGVKAEPDACAALVELVGDDPHALAPEIDKIATWADGEPVGAREVERSWPLADDAASALTDAWGRRDLGGCARGRGGDLRREPRAAARRWRRGSRRHARRPRRQADAQKRLLEDGVAPKDAAAELGMKPFHGAEARPGEGSRTRSCATRRSGSPPRSRAQGRQPPGARARAPARARRPRTRARG